MKLSVLALSALFIAGCATSDTGGAMYAVSHKPPDYVVIYVAESGTTHPDRAYLDIDSTKKQTLYWISDGNDLKVTFKDRDHPFKVDCAGRMCTAKVDKPHKDLYEYRYGVSFINSSGRRVEFDPIVIIDTVMMPMGTGWVHAP